MKDSESRSIRLKHINLYLLLKKYEDASLNDKKQLSRETKNRETYDIHKNLVRQNR